MNGMDATTGKALSGTAHLVQSIADILGTPLGSLVMRRDYGSQLFALIDQPATPATALLMRAATAVALRKWEPRITVTKVTISGTPAEGTLTVGITGTLTDTGDTTASSTLSIPLPATMGGKQSS